MEIVQGPDKLQEKDRQFEQLVTEHQTALLRTCFLYLKDQEMARDAVQETFLKAYHGWDAFRGDSSDKTWLMKIAMNCCRDQRKSAWFRHIDRRFTPDDLPPAAGPFTPEEDELIREVVALPVKLREVILLHFYHGMNVNEIAKTLGIAHSSVSGRLKRALKYMKAALEGRDDL